MSMVADVDRRAKPVARRRRTNKARATGRPYIIMNGATMVSIAAIAITIIGFLYLVQTSQVAQLGYDMSRQQTQKETLSFEIAELKYEVARYESLLTVERMATDRLGMSRMNNYQFVTIERPIQSELQLASPPEPASATFFDRVQMAIMGTGVADSRGSSYGGAR